MLLIAVSGPVGSGKTTLLRTLAEWWRESGREPEGFLAEGAVRAAGSGGAPRYDLIMLRSRVRLPFAVRDESLQPPYRFDETAGAALEQWVAGLATDNAPTLVLLDEFGPIEAAGGGHIRLWPRLSASRPEIAVIAVRKGLEEALSLQLGRAFDLVVDAESPEAWENLRRACVAHSDWMRIGLYGGGAGGFEASVGALLHGGQVPLRGLFMSSMQSVIMTYAADGLGVRRRVVWVSFLAASLKAFSPTGNRLRPMLAITVQGFLYMLAITLLGWNALGAAAGGFLVGGWSAIQGVALQYLFVGNELFRAYDSILQWVARQMDVKAFGFLALVAAWTAVCGLVTAVLTVLAWGRRHRMPSRLREAMFRSVKGFSIEGKPAGMAAAFRHGFRDIARPLFWLPVVVVGGVMLASGSPLASILWVVVRAAGMGFVLFSAVRAFDVGRFMTWLQRRGHWGPALAYQRALSRFQPSEHPSADSKS